MTRPLVVVLRPEPGATRTAQALNASGIDPLIAPLFAVEPVPIESSSHHRAEMADIDAVMITSANAVQYCRSQLQHYGTLPIYAVGPATAAAIARQTGRQDIRIAPAGTAQSLIDMAKRDGHAHLLHLCGADVRPIDPAGLVIERLVAYRTQSVSSLPAALIAAWPHIAAIMVHSPRAASRFDQLVTAQSLPRDTPLIVISAATAAHAGSGWPAIHVAATPDDTAMLAVARQLCQ